MPLTAGQTLSFYETLGSQRAAAMGEVYRSEDTRFGREAESLADRIARGALRLELTGDLLESALVAPRPPSSRAVIAAFMFLALIAGPVFEEVMSRGYLQSALIRCLLKWAAITITWLAFMAGHGPPILGPMYFVFSAAWGWVFAQAKSLNAAIAFHMLKNLHRHRGDGMEASNY